MPEQGKEYFDPTVIESRPWVPIPGFPDMMHEKILTVHPGTGPWKLRARLIRMQPGIETKEPVSHDYWEVVYILEGCMVDSNKGETFNAGMYCCRPPGTWHGPYKFPFGAMCFETHCYLE